MNKESKVDFWCLLWAYLGTFFFTVMFITGFHKSKYFFPLSWGMFVIWVIGVTILYHRAKYNFYMDKINTRYCKHCKKDTVHIPHGFIGSNYRETCRGCDLVNYIRGGL